LERDIERVLGSLAHDFPLLTSLVERRRGGQRHLLLGTPTAPDQADALVSQDLHAEEPGLASAGNGTANDETEGSAAEPHGESDATSNRQPPSEDGVHSALISGAVPGRKRKSVAGKLGVELRFESRPESTQLGRLLESTVWINEAHPAYARAQASRSEGYHVALTVALTLAPFAVEPQSTHEFVTAFLTHWGQAAERKAKR
jgi:hypothetical protein